MTDKFDLRKYLIENKVTANSKLLNEEKSTVRLLAENRLDQILDKINASGINSLTNKEKAFLYGSNSPKASQEISTDDKFDYQIAVRNNRTENYNLVEKLIKNLLNRNNIECEVNRDFLGLGMGFIWYVRLKEGYSNTPQRAEEILNKNGFTVLESGPCASGACHVKTPSHIEDKLNDYKKQDGILLVPAHGNKLNPTQEIKRILKIIKKNGIKNHMISVKHGLYNLILPNLSEEEKNNIISTLNQKGYYVND